MTRPRSNNRDLTHWIVMLAVGAAVYLLGCRITHAAALADPMPASPGIDWTFWIAVTGAVLGGISAALHVIAPRTKNTIDDKIRDDIDEVLAFVRGSTLPGKPSQLTVAPPPRNTQAGFMGREILLTIAFFAAIALAAGMVATSCTATQARQTAAVGVVAALDCEAQHLTGEALGDLRGLAEHTVQSWISGAPSADIATLRAKVKADLALFKTDAGRCAIAGALTAIGSVVSRPGEALSALSADPTPVRAAFALESRAAAWPALQVAGAVY